MTLSKEIQAGTIHLSIKNGEARLDELLTFASRQNPIRPFLFVSKVLGKHIPVKPSKMRFIYNELAYKIELANLNTYVVGMAETAVGLGFGIADSLSSLQKSSQVFYQHTTRHNIDSPILFTIEESHSHASRHIFYKPSSDLYDQIMISKRLVIVDDEITTGNTIYQLIEKITFYLDHLEEILIVSIVNWLDKEHKEKFLNLKIKVKFISLLDGKFSFEKKEKTTNFPTAVDSNINLSSSVSNSKGRIGIKMPFKLPKIERYEFLKSKDKISIVGIGEYLFEPFLYAEKLEKLGFNTFYQSTTRSPILLGDCIKKKESFFDLGSKFENYIYNLDLDSYIIICCETKKAEEENGLFSSLINNKDLHPKNIKTLVL